MFDLPKRPHRIGLIVPSSNLTMETELPALFAAHARAHGTAFTFHSSRMRMTRVTPEELRAMNEQLGRAAGELADARCDVVATACLIAFLAVGPTAHEDAEADIARTLAAEGAPAPVVSSAGALIEGLRALGAKRVALVAPYLRPLTERVVASIEGNGIEVRDSLSLEVADNLRVAALDPADLLEHWRRLDLGGCDALVLSACVQMPSLAAIDAVERACGIPVVSAATATAAAILRARNLPLEIPGAGALLRDSGFAEADLPSRTTGELR